MMAEYLAHSAKFDYPAQTYASHINGVYNRATHYAVEADRHAFHKDSLTFIVQQSSLLHDLGKLDDENQIILHNPQNTQKHLPINHVDAGSAALKENNKMYSALVVYSHHRGLPDMASECLKNENMFRDEHPLTRKHTDSMLKTLIQRHQTLFSLYDDKKERFYGGDQGIFFRMALSCIADADHTDTAAAYGQVSEHEELPQLRAEERLAALDQYVLKLGDHNERSHLRQEMYSACRDAKINSKFATCDSPVGSGKTTAVMAHLLQQALYRNARHIFVVLPYTSIIQQSVDVYRKALVLPGENPEEIVAELHSRADFQDYDTRYLTSLWRAPIIVTTAVAFFETIASNRPAVLRKFHELPGSVIFIDEAHNALPLKLLPLAWKWMNVLSEEWNCYWVLASGSLVRYWKLNRLTESQINMTHPTVSELVQSELRTRLMKYEQNRIQFCWRSKPIGRKELVEWIHQFPGPRLLILNTVQNAAVIANDLCHKYGRNCVEHISTALTPEDRSATIERVKQRLQNSCDTDWTLVATSCVEAGVDFSFQTGFREMASLLSLLQAAGRINRHGIDSNASMWSFEFQDDSMLNNNPQLAASVEVLRNYFMRNIEISPELSTQSMNDEIVRDDSCLKVVRHLLKQEDAMQFETIENEFHVIDSNTVSVIVDASLADDVICGQGNWKLLQKKSVSIWREKIKCWNIKNITGDIYQWTLQYDKFWGYMRGVLELL